MATQPIDVERSVKERYARAAEEVEPSLCCPISYDPRLLAAIPQEVLACDYGCGDPSRYLRQGETVLDLGSGAGKICFIASQVVGSTGQVIGVDMNDAMLSVARRNLPLVAEKVGYSNVRFLKARIQDMALDLDAVDGWLRAHPIRTSQHLAEFECRLADLRSAQPAVRHASVDVVISNCVLNLVRPEDKARLFGEIFRVLRRGGRAVISDIVSDELVPEHMQRDPELWSGCISGALREGDFLRHFEEAGFYGVTIVERQSQPWRTVEGIEFRSLTVAAYKGKEGPCWDHKQAVIYKGPFREVADDDGHLYRRGVRTAVCEKTFQLLAREPYSEHFEPVEPLQPVEPSAARPFACTSGAAVRHPGETKNEGYRTNDFSDVRCEPGNGNGSCC